MDLVVQFSASMTGTLYDPKKSWAGKETAGSAKAVAFYFNSK